MLPERYNLSLTVREEGRFGKLSPQFGYIFTFFQPNFTPVQEKTRLLTISLEKRMFLPPGEVDKCVSGKCGTKKSICCDSNFLRKSVLR